MIARTFQPIRVWLDRLTGAGGLTGSRIFSPTGSVSLFSVQVQPTPGETAGEMDDQAKRAFLATEYGECRAAIGKFDGILTDLRTRGVALVLTFNGVSAIVSATVQTTVLGGQWRLATVVQLIAMLLIIPLLRLDFMYTRFLLESVKRAQAIEDALGTLLVHKESGTATRPLSQALETAAGTDNSVTRNVQLVVYGGLFVLGLFLAYLYQTAGGY